MRRRMIAGNWKMNNLCSDVGPFVQSLNEKTAGGLASARENVDILLSVPATQLQTASQASKAVSAAAGGPVTVAAQNVHWEASGAFTGELSIAMIREAGATATLIGHSERRQYFGETDETVSKKLQAVLDADMIAIVCIGETLEEREQGRTGDVVLSQLDPVLEVVKGVGTSKVGSNFIIAYEPVWAIGTGLAATASQAGEVHSLIRRELQDKLGEKVANDTQILYGGSMKPENIEELLAQEDIDGGLIGGASLKPEALAAMIGSAIA